LENQDWTLNILMGWQPIAKLLNQLIHSFSCKFQLHAGWKAGHYCIMFIVLCGGVCAQDGKAGYEPGTKNYLL
jgi:hypothetical protein